MHIAVVGAGAAGIFTAWELIQDGHHVTVIDRHATAGEGASFGHGGLLAPACAALEIGHPGMSPQSIGSASRGWRTAWVGKTPTAPERPSLADNPRTALALWSQERLSGIVDALGLQWQKTNGVLVLLRGPKDAVRLTPMIDALRDAGIAADMLEPPAARLREPGLETETALAAALLLPGDMAGNCRQLLLQIRATAEQYGAVFIFQEEVVQLHAGAAPTLVCLRPDHTTLTRKFDSIILSCGTGAAQLLKTADLRYPFTRLQTYSVSAPIREPSYAPLASVIDSRYPAVITRLGERVRVSGGTHRGKASVGARATAMRMLYRALQENFPGAAKVSSGVQEWTGERLALPDDLPLLGPSGAPGIWLHLAHGVHHMALAPGAARLLANALSEPVLPQALQSFGISRLGHGSN